MVKKYKKYKWRDIKDIAQDKHNNYKSVNFDAGWWTHDIVRYCTLCDLDKYWSFSNLYTNDIFNTKPEKFLAELHSDIHKCTWKIGNIVTREWIIEKYFKTILSPRGSWLDVL